MTVHYLRESQKTKIYIPRLNSIHGKIQDVFRDAIENKARHLETINKIMSKEQPTEDDLAYTIENLKYIGFTSTDFELRKYSS